MLFVCMFMSFCYTISIVLNINIRMSLNCDISISLSAFGGCGSGNREVVNKLEVPGLIPASLSPHIGVSLERHLTLYYLFRFFRQCMKVTEKVWNIAIWVNVTCAVKALLSSR